MAVVASGWLSLALENLRTLLAACPSFQTWVGAADAAAAKARIHRVSKAGPTRPFALVDQWTDASATAFAGGAGESFTHSGSQILRFEGEVSEQDSDEPADAFYTFWNAVGAIILEMEQLSGTDGYLVVRSIMLEDGPFRSKDFEGEADDYYYADFVVEWGPGR